MALLGDAVGGEFACSLVPSVDGKLAPIFLEQMGTRRFARLKVADSNPKFPLFMMHFPA
jgi:hypothetical protein